MLHKPPRSRPKNKQTIRKSLQRHQPLRGRGTLSEINPLAGNLLLKANTFCHSAIKKRRTEEADTDIGYRSPGGKKIGKFVYKTPDEKGDHDASSIISSTLSGTGFSKDYPLEEAFSQKSMKRPSSLSFFSISKDCNDRIQGNAIQHRN